MQAICVRWCEGDENGQKSGLIRVILRQKWVEMGHKPGAILAVPDSCPLASQVECEKTIAVFVPRPTCFA